MANCAPQNETIQLHIVPHTHNDAGWLYTLESYYKGTNSRGCVQCILNNVTASLKHNKNRRFSYVEQVFFEIWWQEISNATKDVVREYIRNGQLEFLMGGYVMNDEGCTYYDDIIEQLTLGHRAIKNTFNVTVNTAWHIDPFGHSAAQARIFSEMGFDSWVIERIDYQDFDSRLEKGSLEMIWRPDTYDKDTNFLLTHINYMPYYRAPFNYCIDMLCYPDTDLSEFVRRNVMYANWIKNQTKFYPTNHILHHIGGDFEWSKKAEHQYLAIESVIDFLNSHPEFGINAFFSSPSNYTASVYKAIREKNITLEEKNDDFFPYQDLPHAYWTGYFTSKSTLKYSIREASKHLQSLRKLGTKLFFNKKIKFGDLNSGFLVIERAVSILQHHDAVTGTAKRAVDEDYFKLLRDGYDGILNVILPPLTEWTNDHYVQVGKQFQFCSYDRISCPLISLVNKKKASTILVFNPSQQNTRIVSLQVPRLPLKLQSASGVELVYDMFCDESIKKHGDEILLVETKLVPDEQPNYCQIFLPVNCETNGLTSFEITSTSVDKLKDIILEKDIELNSSETIGLFGGEDFIIEPEAREFVYQISHNQTYRFSLDYRYYQSYFSDKNKDDQASGAYIFRPILNDSQEYSKILKVAVSRGNHVIEIRIERSLVVTKLRFFKDSLPHVIEIESILKPIPVEDNIGKEIVINVHSFNISNDGVFYTDANGLEMQKRVRNKRRTYKIEVTEPAAGNYYPINSAIYIEDKKTNLRMTLMNDRSQGGTSLTNGTIEMMIHRRILHDDARGLFEELNETDSNGEGVTVRTKHWLFFSKGPEKQRLMQYEVDSPPLIFVAESQVGDKIVRENPNDSKSEVDGVKLYVRPYASDELIIRLHNLNEEKTASVQFWSESQGICQRLKELLGKQYESIRVKKVEEVTLDTVQSKAKMLGKKFNWDGNYKFTPKDEDFEVVQLRPLEERVFLLKFENLL